MKKIVLALTLLLTMAGAMGQTAKKAPVKGSAVPAATMLRGKALYNNVCLACHQEDGTGVPHLNPPLAPNEWVSGPKPRIIQLVLHGSQGKVEIDGETWSNSMPANSYLTDQQVADVLTYVRNSFGNKAGAVTVAEVKAQRAKKK